MQGGWSRAVVAKQPAEKVTRERDVTKAVLETLGAEGNPRCNRTHRERDGRPGRGGVTVERTVQTLWEQSSSDIQQVGLIKDESGRTKFTV